MIERRGVTKQTVPNVNSFVDSPDAESAAITADGPGTGVTAIFSLAHTFTYNLHNTLINTFSTICDIWGDPMMLLKLISFEKTN